MLMHPSLWQKHIDQCSSGAKVDMDQFDRFVSRPIDPTNMITLDRGFGASLEVCLLESVDQSD